MKKIVFVTAASETISSFLLAYIHGLSQEHEMHVVTSLSNGEKVRGLNANITTHNIEITRNPNILDDLKSLYQLFKFFKKHQFDIVHSFTPKAGLLSQISAFFARVPIRFHTFTGQVWATQTGIKRLLLKQLDKITAGLATFCLVDSPSQQEFLIKERLLTHKNSYVLAKGSISGVNIDKFSFSQEIREQLRHSHNVMPNDFVFLFVGRLKKEKGLPELVNAFKSLPAKASIKLFIIGSDEDNLSTLFEKVDNIEYIGFKTNIAEYYSFADTLCLPSHREGFGNVIIEAAACCLPAIASNIYGLCDAVEDENSGFLHEVKNVQAITNCMLKVLDNLDTLPQLRSNARDRVVSVFDERVLLKEFLRFYDNFMSNGYYSIDANNKK